MTNNPTASVPMSAASRMAAPLPGVTGIVSASSDLLRKLDQSYPARARKRLLPVRFKFISRHGIGIEHSLGQGQVAQGILPKRWHCL